MSGPKVGPTLDERTCAALRREGEAGAPVLARGLGERQTSVHGALRRGVRHGWARVARKEGLVTIFAYVGTTDVRR